MTKILIAAVVVLFPAAGQASDWPMYRADAARSGYTPDGLPENLSLAWTYRLPHGPIPAWPSRSRLQFDRACQPVVADGMLYVGSSADGVVYALDTATGQTRWTFFTDGPLRFAPAVWRDRVFVASDDGWLYALGAADGRLVWKLRGGPRADMLLGNDRMISRWPVRGGPVVADGVLYFAAGIWPSEGVFIYAVDPDAGKVIWLNDSSGTIEMDQPHPTARAVSGVAAQGYLAVGGDALLVPTGRAVPAVFDRTDGQLRYFHLQQYGKYGGSEVAVVDDHFFNGGLTFALADGARRAPVGSHVAAHPDLLIAARGNQIVARARQAAEGQSVDRKGAPLAAKGFGGTVWSVELSHDAEGALIVAGNRIVAAGQNEVSLIDIAARKAVWTTEVEGGACGLAAADGRLYVSTDHGVICCFDGSGASRPVHIQTPHGVASDEDSVYALAAEEVIRTSGVTEGYCLDLGCGDGRLALELARRTNLQIYAVDADAQKVQAARRMLDAAGLYGVRVTVHRANPAEVPYPDFFADLVVSGRSVTEGPEAVPDDAAAPMQRPYGGVICLGQPGAIQRSVRGPLEEAAAWTHQYANPANTLCSGDGRLRGPLEMLWFRDTDLFMPNRHGRGPALLVENGRMLVEGVDGLRAVSVYNGRTLWEYPVAGILQAYHKDHSIGVAAAGSNVCIGGDRVFVCVGNRCLGLDAPDGSRLAELVAPKRPDGKPGTWGFLAYEDGTLFGSLANEAYLVPAHSPRNETTGLFSESDLFFAMDARNGKLKWTYTPEHSIRHSAVAIGGGRVYLIDRPLARLDPERFAEAAQRIRDSRRLEGKRLDEREEFRKVTEHPLGRIVALDAEDGRVVWKTDENIFGTMLALSVQHGVVLSCYQPAQALVHLEWGDRMAAYQADDGKQLWDLQAKYTARPVIIGRTIYAQPGAWDLMSGKQLSFQFVRSYGCGVLAASRRLLVFRSGTLGYFDLAGNRRTENYGGIRPGCWINAIPAGGLVLLADSASWCTCSYLNQATIALKPADLSSRAD